MLLHVTIHECRSHLAKTLIRSHKEIRPVHSTKPTEPIIRQELSLAERVIVDASGDHATRPLVHVVARDAEFGSDALRALLAAIDVATFVDHHKQWYAAQFGFLSHVVDPRWVVMVLNGKHVVVL